MKRDAEASKIAEIRALGLPVTQECALAIEAGISPARLYSPRIACPPGVCEADVDELQRRVDHFRRVEALTGG